MALLASSRACTPKDTSMKRLVIWLAAALSLGVCSGPLIERIEHAVKYSRTVSAASIDSRITVANNKFGFSVFDNLLQDKPEENCIISPVSIDLALSVLAQGAAGKTQKAILDALNLTNFDAAQIAEHDSDLLRFLAQTDPNITFEVANSILVSRDHKLKDDFANSNRWAYDAEIRDEDFHSPGAIQNVNRWVAEKTHGKIPTIVNEFPANTLALLLNAVYFKGNWNTEFDEKKSRPWNFITLDGQKKQTTMMSDCRIIPYMKGDGFSAVKLSYGKENKSELWVFLPDQKPQLGKKGSSEDFIGLAKKIIRKDWTLLDSSFKDTLVELLLPKFKCEIKHDLKRCLRQMGMGNIFEEDADFSNMFELKSGQNACVSEVKHKTFIEMNEKGTEAAAVTAVKMVPIEYVEPRESRSTPFTADHPFVFGVRNRETGAILFMGAIADPQ